MTCGLCGRGYVGETSRSLVVRYKEPYRSAAYPTVKILLNSLFKQRDKSKK